MAIEVIRPTSTLITAPDYQHWKNSVSPSGSGGVNSWSTVDEAVSDEDTTYVQCATTTRSFEHFGMSAPGISGYTITNVRVCFRCKYSTANGYARAIVGGVGGVVGDTKTSTASFQTFTQDWAINPITSSAWVWSDFTTYLFGIEGWGSGTKANNRCTQFYVEITYDVPNTVIRGLILKGLIIK
jgi:hypothetical protein